MTPSEALRQAIQSSDKTAYQIAKESGVAAIVISRFLRGERDLRLSTLDKLAPVVGLVLKEGKK